MTPEPNHQHRGRAWAVTSILAAVAAVFLIGLIMDAGRKTFFGEWLGLSAAGILISIGLIASFVTLWRSRCGRWALAALIANGLAVILVVVWWVWPTPHSFRLAIKRGDISAVRFALRTGVDVEALEIWGMGVEIPGRSPLALAAGTGNAEMVQLLLDWEADVNRRDGHGSYPLNYAAWSGDVPTVRLLLEAGADPTALSRQGEWSALHTAAGMGHLEVIDLLLEAGVPVDLPNRDGRTPLESARMSGNDAAIEHLLEKGAQSPEEARGQE